MFTFLNFSFFFGGGVWVGGGKNVWDWWRRIIWFGLDGYPRLGTVVRDTSTNTDIGKDSKPTEYDE
jgi:hypothetical protein